MCDQEVESCGCVDEECTVTGGRVQEAEADTQPASRLQLQLSAATGTNGPDRLRGRLVAVRPITQLGLSDKDITSRNNYRCRINKRCQAQAVIEAALVGRADLSDLIGNVNFMSI